MQEYFMRSFVYFIALMALTFLVIGRHPDLEDATLSEVVASNICVSLVPFFRVLIAVLFVIVFFVPSSESKKAMDKKKEKESIDLRKQYKG